MTNYSQVLLLYGTWWLSDFLIYCVYVNYMNLCKKRQEWDARWTYFTPCSSVSIVNFEDDVILYSFPKQPNSFSDFTFLPKLYYILYFALFDKK